MNEIIPEPQNNHEYFTPIQNSCTLPTRFRDMSSRVCVTGFIRIIKVNSPPTNKVMPWLWIWMGFRYTGITADEMPSAHVEFKGLLGRKVFIYCHNFPHSFLYNECTFVIFSMPVRFKQPLASSLVNKYYRILLLCCCWGNIKIKALVLVEMQPSRRLLILLAMKNFERR